MSNNGVDDPFVHAALEVQRFIFGGAKRSSSEAEVVSAARYDTLLGKHKALFEEYEEQGKAQGRTRQQMLIMMREYVIQAGMNEGNRLVQSRVAKDVLDMESGRTLNLGLASSHSQAKRADLASAHAGEVMDEMLSYFVRTTIIHEDELSLLAWPTQQDLRDLYLVEVEGASVPGVQPLSKGSMPVDNQWMKSIMRNDTGGLGVTGDSPLTQIMRKNGTYEAFELTEGAKVARESQLRNKSKRLLEEERVAARAAEAAANAQQARPGILRRILGG